MKKLLFALFILLTPLLINNEVSQNSRRVPLSNDNSTSCSFLISKFITKAWASPWKFDQSFEKSLKSIFEEKSLDDRQKVSKLFHLLLDKRTLRYSKKKQMELKKILSIAQDPNNPLHATYKSYLDLSPVGYDPINRKVAFSIGPKNKSEWTLTHYIALIHEMQHAMYDYQSNIALPYKIIRTLLESFSLTMGSVSRTTVYFDEIKALGAQWELVSRMPSSTRKNYLKLFDIIDNYSIHSPSEIAEAEKRLTTSTSHTLLKVIRASLEHADLSKEEFIEKLKVVHRYKYSQLMRLDKKQKMITYFWTSVASFQVLYFLSTQENELLPIPPVDLYLLLMILDLA